MERSRTAGKAIGYTVGAAVAASMIVLIAGALVFGANLSQWAEWEGRAVGVVGTIAGVAGAVIGLRLAHRDDPRDGD